MKLSRGAKRLFDLLIWHGKKHGFDSIFPPQTTLARLLKCSIQTVLRWVAELKKASVMAVKKYGRRPAAYLLSQEYVEQRLAGKNERSTRGLREVGERSGRPEPLYSLDSTGITPLAERKKPPRREQHQYGPSMMALVREGWL